MSWSLGPNGETYRYRLAATALTSSVTPGDSYNVAITIGPDQEAFWNTVQANGYDIRLSTSAGNGGGISYQRFYWDTTVKGAILRATVTLPATATAGACHVLYVYWGPESGTVVTDPSTDTPGGTVSASVIAPLNYPEGPTIRLDGGAWRQDGSSNTPTPAQTVVCGVGERRYGIADLGPDWRYPAGYSLNGHDQAGDVDWVHVVVTGSDASAPNWAISDGLRVYVDDVGAAVRVQLDVSHASDGLAVLYVGRSTGRIEKHYYRLRGIEPAI
jgi:hypothetical protein